LNRGDFYLFLAFNPPNSGLVVFFLISSRSLSRRHSSCHPELDLKTKGNFPQIFVIDLEALAAATDPFAHGFLAVAFFVLLK
jgi:hypothetical protein